MAELKDYNGPFIPDLKYDDFSKEVLTKLLVEYGRVFIAMDGFYHTYLTEKFGMEQAGLVGVDMWKKAFELTRRRVGKLLKIEGNTVETLFKQLQVDPGLSHEIYTYNMDLKNKNHGILTVTKCLTLEFFERQGDGREKEICQGSETMLFIAGGKIINPAMEVTRLKIPPRANKNEIACQWEYRIPNS